MGKGRTLLRVLRAAQEPKATQADIATRAERELPRGRTMSRSRYAQIESGWGKPADADEQEAVAAALGVKASAIAWPSFPNTKAS